MEIFGFRMISGEDIITEIVKELPDGSFEIRRPVVPVPIDEQGHLRFLKWNPYAENEKFTISPTHFITKYEILAGLENSYLQMTSGILQPTTGGNQRILTA